MGFLQALCALVPLLALGNCHAVILNAQGEKGSPSSVGFQVDEAVARNCITINPCQQDTTIIRDAEIKANIVNTCGRTQLRGNVDVGENTENALAANRVTQVKAGGDVSVTIHQVNADGAGPFVCDLDMTSNVGLQFTNLTIQNNVPGANGLSQAKTQAFNMTLKLPNDLRCTGGSTGNICTIRCRNNAVAGPFGGCFAVQQSDVGKTTNSPGQITTVQSMSSILEQVRKNQKDFSDAVNANKNATSNEAMQNLAAVQALLKETVVTKPAGQPTPVVGGGEGGSAPAPTGVNQGNGGNQGNNGGSQGGVGGNQGGSTGNQGGSTGNQGGSTGNQGGSTGNQGGSTGNQGENNVSQPGGSQLPTVGSGGGNQGGPNGSQGENNVTQPGGNLGGPNGSPGENNVNQPSGGQLPNVGSGGSSGGSNGSPGGTNNSQRGGSQLPAGSGGGTGSTGSTGSTRNGQTPTTGGGQGSTRAGTGVNKRNFRVRVRM
ncbi:hypothetical protein QQS21_012669 [Conoideocrella luteorostrata]|uniref:GEgh 16 protein n=1 Tax=Conoideocrella luteorostrata TaxID=1105319 RepID=A0AAJ0CDL2_9HYPO|nr:hypothetical protein QQS21_012669 [Conoideocrella luteorostrata]